MARRWHPGDSGGYVLDAASGTLYKRGRFLGEGASGRCHELADVRSGRVYAAKIIPRARLDEPGVRQRLQRELELHGRLRHPHVVGFHGHFAAGRNVYVVLELCARGSLADVLRARGRLPEHEVRFYLRQLLAGLRYLHGQGILHRDLKPSNLLLTERLRLKIGDLGLARRVTESGRCWGARCGTPAYLAPEVLDGKGHSAASDVWALGCITYAALAGHPPFEGAGRRELLERIRAARCPPPRGLSPAARALLGALLAPEPAARPGLRQLLQHDFVTQGPARPGLVGCHPLRSVLAALSRRLGHPPPRGDAAVTPLASPTRQVATDPPEQPLTKTFISAGNRLEPRRRDERGGTRAAQPASPLGRGRRDHGGDVSVPAARGGHTEGPESSPCSRAPREPQPRGSTGSGRSYWRDKVGCGLGKDRGKRTLAPRSSASLPRGEERSEKQPWKLSRT